MFGTLEHALYAIDMKLRFDSYQLQPGLAPMVIDFQTIATKAQVKQNHLMDILLWLMRDSLIVDVIGTEVKYFNL